MSTSTTQTNSRLLTTDDIERGRLLLTVEQVASLLSVNVDTVKNLHRTGQLKGVKIGKHLRWRVGDVEAFVEQLDGNQ